MTPTRENALASVRSGARAKRALPRRAEEGRAASCAYRSGMGRTLQRPALMLGSNLLKREVREVGPFFRMLDRHGADVPATVDVNLGVLVQVLGLDDVTGLELDVQGVPVLKVPDLHGVNERSKAISFTCGIAYLNAAYQPRRALRAVGWVRLVGRADPRASSQRLSDSWLSLERRPARRPSMLRSSSSEGQ